MLIMRLGCLSVLWTCTCFVASAHAQDNELQKLLVKGFSPNEAKLNLAYWQAECEGLDKVIEILTHYQREQLAKLEAKRQQLHENMSGDDLETTQALLRNARMELQKLVWDEAAESAMLEELETGQPKIKATRQSLLEAEMRGRLEIAERDLNSLLQQLTEMNSRNHSRSEITAQTVKVEHAHAEIEALKKQLPKVAEINKAEAELPATESKRRLAQIRVRRKLMENEISELTKRLPALRERASSQWMLDLERKTIESVQERITPLQVRKLELDAMVAVLEVKVKEKEEVAK